MNKKQSIRDGILSNLAKLYTDNEIEVIEELPERNKDYAKMRDINTNILIKYPKLYESVLGNGDTAPLSAEEHEALRDLLINYVDMFRTMNLHMFMGGIEDCLYMLNVSGVIKKEYMKMNIIDIGYEKPSMFKDMY